MQGSYNKNGLPRPYYMKPSKGKHSPYDNLPINHFNTPRRKIIGYLIILCLFGLSVYSIGESLRAKPDPVYELEAFTGSKQSEINNIVEVDSNEKDSNNLGLAGNLAMNSKGDVGMGVNEAPKGGIANEAPVVGNDEDAIVEGKRKKKMAAAAAAAAGAAGAGAGGVDIGSGSGSGKGAGSGPGAIADFEETIEKHQIDDV